MRSPLARHCAVALVAVAVAAAFGFAACSSSKSASVASTTVSQPATTPPTAAPPTAAPPTAAPPTNTEGPTPDICSAYLALSQHDLRSVNDRSRYANNWPALRAALASDIAANRVLYGTVALAATGSVRSDAQLVADFMPVSRELLLESTSLLGYETGLPTIPGDAEVIQAAGRLSDNAASTCNIQLVHHAEP